jgi:hypothetical protein
MRLCHARCINPTSHISGRHLLTISPSHLHCRNSASARLCDGRSDNEYAVGSANFRSSAPLSSFSNFFPWSLPSHLDTSDSRIAPRSPGVCRLGSSCPKASINPRKLQPSPMGPEPCNHLDPQPPRLSSSQALSSAPTLQSTSRV